MGNTQSGLTGIHPFKDADAQVPVKFIPPVEIANLTLPEYSLPQPVNTEPEVTSIPVPPTWTSVSSNPEPEKLNQLFTVRPPTPPPRKLSYDHAIKPARKPKQSLLHRGFVSLRTLPRFISRPDLAKIRGLFKRKRVVVGEIYPVPPDAEKPSPPSKPDVIHEQDEFFLLRWDPPAYDGGLPIIGYIIQHLELGLPQTDENQKDDTQSWYSSEPGAVTSTEVLLNNLIPGTTYQFRVIAENLLGYSSPSEISHPIVFNPNGELDDWFCAPTLIVGLNEHHTVIEHERLILNIEVTGQPYPITKWYGKNGEELAKSLDPLKYNTQSTGYKRVLTINAVDTSDSGVIRCVCENERGVVECATNLVVEAPPHIRRITRDTLSRGTVNTEDPNMMFHTGELALLKFAYSGSPRPNVCVYHDSDLVDGEEVPGSSGRVYHERIATEVTDNIITVKISGVKRTDRGDWVVRLDNVLGEDSASVLVTITDRPSEPGTPDVLQLSDNTVILKWDVPYDDGGCPVTSYTVEYFRSEWGVWLKACTTKNPYTKIRDLIPGSKYRFRVKSENLYGSSEASGESVELLITDVTSTLRSVSGEGTTSLMMGTVFEEEDEEPVRIDQQSPGSSLSINRVSSGTNTDIVMLKPPNLSSSGIAASENESSSRSETTKSPNPVSSNFLKISLHPKVIVQEEEGFSEEEDPEFEHRLEHSPFNISPAHTRSPSPNITAKIINPGPEGISSQTASPVPPPRKITTQPPDSHETVKINLSQQPLVPPRSNVRGLSPTPVTRTIQQTSQSTCTPAEPEAIPQAQITFQPKPIPVVIRVEDQSKKLYSRAEIIKSAAPLDMKSLSFEHDRAYDEEEEAVEEEEEEDPELRQVKEALSKDDFEIGTDEEDEYEVDFDILQQEYEEDKRKGVISRQDSGVSDRGALVSRTTSIEEEEEPEEEIPESNHGRPHSSMSEAYTRRTPRMISHASFERAQSEVTSRVISSPIRVIEIEPEVIIPPKLEPRRSSSTMLHDRFTDYLAMKASSRNKLVGSSYRSLNSSRQSSNENISRDSGRSSMVHQPLDPGNKNFVLRQFDPNFECEAVRKLERSVSVGAKSLSIFTVSQQNIKIRSSDQEQHPHGSDGIQNQEIQQHPSTNVFISNPEFQTLYQPDCHVPQRGFSSETQVQRVQIPDSGLKEKIFGIHHNPGGVDPNDEEEYDEEEHRSNQSVSSDHQDRDLPRDRENRLRKHVSFGSSNEVFSEREERNEEELENGEEYEVYGEEQHGNNTQEYEELGEEQQEKDQEQQMEVQRKKEQTVEDETQLEQYDDKIEEDTRNQEFESSHEVETQEPATQTVENNTQEFQHNARDSGAQEYVQTDGCSKHGSIKNMNDMSEDENLTAVPQEESQEYEEEEENLIIEQERETEFLENQDTPGDEISDEEVEEEYLEEHEYEYEYDDENAQVAREGTESYDEEYYNRVYEIGDGDEDEVFEMDVDGIDPRTYEGYETGEEDSGIMYVLLQDPTHESLHLTDISAYAPDTTERKNEKLTDLLVKLDQFLEEEEDMSGVEEIERDEQNFDNVSRVEDVFDDEQGNEKTGEQGNEEVGEQGNEEEGHQGNEEVDFHAEVTDNAHEKLDFEDENLIGQHDVKEERDEEAFESNRYQDHGEEKVEFNAHGAELPDNAREQLNFEEEYVIGQHDLVEEERGEGSFESNRDQELEQDEEIQQKHDVSEEQEVKEDHITHEETHTEATENVEEGQEYDDFQSHEEQMEPLENDNEDEHPYDTQDYASSSEKENLGILFERMKFDDLRDIEHNNIQLNPELSVLEILRLEEPHDQDLSIAGADDEQIEVTGLSEDIHVHEFQKQNDELQHSCNVQPEVRLHEKSEIVQDDNEIEYTRISDDIINTVVQDEKHGLRTGCDETTTEKLVSNVDSNVQESEDRRSQVPDTEQLDTPQNLEIVELHECLLNEQNTADENTADHSTPDTVLSGNEHNRIVPDPPVDSVKYSDTFVQSRDSSEDQQVSSIDVEEMVEYEDTHVIEAKFILDTVKRHPENINSRSSPPGDVEKTPEPPISTIHNDSKPSDTEPVMLSKTEISEVSRSIESSSKKTFSYKQYIAEHPIVTTTTPVLPQQSRAVSIPRTLTPVTEEPSLSHVLDTPIYRPNLKAYVEIQPARKQRVQTYVEPVDSPISIDEIRARILGTNEPINAAPDPEPEIINPPDRLIKNIQSLEQESTSISPFMSYLFNAAFYLMLSPMLLFIDSLYFGLFSLLLIACVHFFLIR